VSDAGADLNILFLTGVSTMDFLNIGMDQLADIGFGLLVIGICLKTLFTDRSALSKQREVWKEELQALEISLRELIAEAGDASQVFDKRIQRRQSELESLLRRAERTVSEAKDMTTKLRESTNKTGEESEFSLGKESEGIEDPPWAKMVDDSISLPPEVEASLMSARARAKKDFSQAPEKNKSSRSNLAQQKRDVRTPLQRQIEMQTEEEVSDEHIFRQTSIVDPVAFRIAKRLLLEGKELHVVSRKLELPVSEIRHLDTLLRQDAHKENLPLPKALAEKEIVQVRGIVRDPAEKVKYKAKRLSSIKAFENQRKEALKLELEDEQDDDSSSLF